MPGRALCIGFLVALGLVLPRMGPAEGQPSVTQYRLGDGLDLNAVLMFGSNGRYTFHWFGCLGLVARSSGDYTTDDSTIVLKPDSADFKHDPRTFSESLHRIRWGEREYLIPEERMLDFTNAINAGAEPRSPGHGLFYLRDGDDAKGAAGDPDLGGKWSAFVLRQPLAGSVLRVEQRETQTQRPIAVIDAGAKAGLRPGMTLSSWNPRRPHFFAMLTVLDVLEDSARVIVPFQYNHIRACDVWHSQRGAAQQPDASDERRVASCLRAARS